MTRADGKFLNMWAACVEGIPPGALRLSAETAESTAQEEAAKMMFLAVSQF